MNHTNRNKLRERNRKRKGKRKRKRKIHGEREKEGWPVLFYNLWTQARTSTKLGSILAAFLPSLPRVTPVLDAGCYTRKAKGVVLW